MKKTRKNGTIQDPGVKVAKYTGKPFKSHRKVNTVKGIVTHPILGTPAFTFEEDDSFVDVRMCRPATVPINQRLFTTPFRHNAADEFEEAKRDIVIQESYEM